MVETGKSLSLTSRFMDRDDWGNGVVNSNALIEALIQLTVHRQYEIIDSLLDACSRAELEPLMVLRDRAFNVRLSYTLEKHLNRTDAIAGKRKRVMRDELVSVLNKWCKDGRRSSVRRVLSELQQAELAEWYRLSSVDGEIHSMLREFYLIDDLDSAYG